MHKLYLIIIFCFTFDVGHSQAPNWEWAFAAGGINSDESRCVTVDMVENIIVTGYFSDSITFGSYNFTKGGLFIVKFDSSGNVLWAKAAKKGFGTGVTTDLNGNIYVTGSFVDSMTLGTITLYATWPNPDRDIFTAKLDPAGNALWAKAGNGDDVDWGNAIAVDKNGNVFIGGDFGGDSVRLGSFTVFNSSWGSRDIILAKYDSNGNVLWLKKPYGNYWDECHGIALDTTGNIFMTGTFASPTLDFGIVSINGNSTYTCFVAKYDTNGNVIWARSASGFDYQYGNGVATDDDGNAYVTGDYDGIIIFGSDTLTQTNNFYSDVFIVKYDQIGNVIWAQKGGGNHIDECVAIAADRFGNTVITGSFYSDSITFDGINYFPNNGFTNSFTTKYDANGNAVWTATSGGSASAFPLGIAMNENKNIYITGKFQGQPISFGTIDLNNEGWVDLFIAKLAGDTITSLSNLQFPGSVVRIFPNPATGIVQISFTDFPDVDFAGNYYFEIFNMTAESVLVQKLKSTNFELRATLDISHLATGIYIYEIRNKNAVIKSGKLVKE